MFDMNCGKVWKKAGEAEFKFPFHHIPAVS